MRNFFDDKDGKRRFPIPAIIAMSLAGLVIAAALALFFGWIVMLLWNWLMPGIFKLPTITYWQGWGLVLLSHILVKPAFGPGGRGHMHGPRGGHEWRRRMDGRFGGERQGPEAPETVADPEAKA